jgi:hypothetical protein
MKHPQGNVTVSFTGALNGGSGAMVEPFVTEFLPTGLTIFFKPNIPERLELAGISLTTSSYIELFKEYYQLLESDAVELSNISLTSA